MSLRPLLAALVLGLGLAGPARADAITDVISDQLDAFAERDPARAFSFASPMIQGMFGNPDVFGHMVEQAYPMIWTPRDPTFGPRREDGAQVFQQLWLEDARGVVRIMEYEMIRTDQGWKINGVRELKVPDVAA